AAALTGHLQQLLKTPNDEVSRAAVRRARRELAEGWLAMPDQQLERTYTAGAGKLQLLLGRGMAKVDAMDEVDGALLDRLAGVRDPASPARIADPQIIRQLLAATLYLRADQLS